MAHTATHALANALANATNTNSEYFAGLLGGTTAVPVIFAGNVTMKSNFSVGGDTQLGNTTTSKLGFYGISGITRQTLFNATTEASSLTDLNRFVGSLRTVLTGLNLLSA